MELKVLLSLLLCGAGVVRSFHTVVYEYYFVNSAKTWYDAQTHCRTHYTDLATFRNTDEMRKVIRPRSPTYAWIGLYDDPASWKQITNDSNSWRWSDSETIDTSQYTAWYPGFPDNTGSGEHCVYVHGGYWNDYPCNTQLYFACFKLTDGSGSKEYFPVQTVMTWEAARSYCREHYTDLATIQTEAENSIVASFLWDHRVWIGLYRVAWRWSDGTNHTISNWDVRQPVRGSIEHCAVENNAHYWHDAQCTRLFAFICHKAMTNKIAHVQVKLQTLAGLSDSTNQDQILAQVSEKFMDLGITDIKLRWTVHPRKKPNK